MEVPTGVLVLKQIDSAGTGDYLDERWPRSRRSWASAIVTGVKDPRAVILGLVEEMLDLGHDALYDVARDGGRGRVPSRGQDLSTSTSGLVLAQHSQGSVPPVFAIARVWLARPLA